MDSGSTAENVSQMAPFHGSISILEICALVESIERARVKQTVKSQNNDWYI
jgi:hypothetical protein